MTQHVLASLRAAVEAAVETEGQKGFSERKGVPLGLVRQARAGQNLTASSISVLSEALGLEFYVGPHRNGQAPPSSPLPLQRDFGLGGQGDEFAAIGLHDIEASAGPGRTPDNEDPVGALAFRQSWLQRESIKPDRAAVIRVHGDSMSPTLNNGDIILVRFDAPGLAEGDFINGGIYVIRADGEVHVKRMFKSGRKIIAVSDDLMTSPMVFNVANAGFAFIGDVVWTGRQLDRPKLLPTQSQSPQRHISR
jgi:phage repressor protein C with HTH and peptisase S24 domain